MRAARSMSELIMITLLLSAFVGFFGLPVAVVNAWQLGGATYDTVGYSGIRYSQWVSGGVPSPYFFAAVSSFYDNSGNPNIWHAITIVDSQSQGVYLEGEWADASGTHDIELCTASKTTFYDDAIYWSASNGAFLYKSFGTSCNTLVLQESGTPKIAGTGSGDFMESNDNTPTDFQNLLAYVAISPTLQYYVLSSGIWQYSHVAHSHNTGDAPSSIGMKMFCSGGQSKYIMVTNVNSGYAPPPGEGKYTINCY